VATSPYRITHKSVILPEYCYSMHYHTCSDFVDPSVDIYHNGPSQPRLGDTVVDPSYAVLHHYRACSTCGPPSCKGPCHRLLANTTLDDTVLRYRRQLMDNVQRVLNTGILHWECCCSSVVLYSCDLLSRHESWEVMSSSRGLINSKI